MFALQSINGFLSLLPFFHHSSYLEDFDLAGGRVEMLCVLSILILFKRVYLDAERDAFLSPVLAHGELCAYAMNLTMKESMKLKSSRER